MLDAAIDRVETLDTCSEFAGWVPEIAQLPTECSAPDEAETKVPLLLVMNSEGINVTVTDSDVANAPLDAAVPERLPVSSVNLGSSVVVLELPDVAIDGVVVKILLSIGRLCVKDNRADSDTLMEIRLRKLDDSMTGTEEEGSSISLGQSPVVFGRAITDAVGVTRMLLPVSEDIVVIIGESEVRVEDTSVLKMLLPVSEGIVVMREASKVMVEESSVLRMLLAI